MIYTAKTHLNILLVLSWVFYLNTLESVFIVYYFHHIFILHINICYIYNIVCKITIVLSQGEMTEEI